MKEQSEMEVKENAKLKKRAKIQKNKYGQYCPQNLLSINPKLLNTLVGQYDLLGILLMYSL